MKNHMQSLPMRDMITTTVSNLHPRKSELIWVILMGLFELVHCINFYFPAYRDTEYYDYGHGEAQEAAYEPYGEILKLISNYHVAHALIEDLSWALVRLDVYLSMSINWCFFFLSFVAQDDWDNSWSNSGGGGKAPMSRQAKGSYREHPYGRYWTATGRELLLQLSQIVTLWTFQK